jgi:hypothetical protein
MLLVVIRIDTGVSAEHAVAGAAALAGLFVEHQTVGAIGMACTLAAVRPVGRTDALTVLANLAALAGPAALTAVRRIGVNVDAGIATFFEPSGANAFAVPGRGDIEVLIGAAGGRIKTARTFGVAVTEMSGQRAGVDAPGLPFMADEDLVGGMRDGRAGSDDAGKGASGHRTQQTPAGCDGDGSSKNIESVAVH